MSAIESDATTPDTTARRVALVHAQLEPIQTRMALIESYRREALCRIVIPALSSGSAVEVLELAYAMRWLELEVDTAPVEVETVLLP